MGQQNRLDPCLQRASGFWGRTNIHLASGTVRSNEQCSSCVYIYLSMSFFSGFSSSLEWNPNSLAPYTRPFMKQLGSPEGRTDPQAHCAPWVSHLCCFGPSWPLLSWADLSVDLKHCHLWALPDFLRGMFLLCAPKPLSTPSLAISPAEFFIFSSNRFWGLWG